MSKYQEYKGLNLSEISDKVLEQWEKENIFEKSIKNREGSPAFVFYEGPPSANGLPGIHHVMARTLKDIFCRYKTLKGFRVDRKAGWDTHGLPVELGVEKELGITKEDIGKSISVDGYNEACKKAVMKYTDIWNDLTRKSGYWVDLENPYVTYKSKYMETVWYLLKELYKKDYLYKGYTIQPYSPAAGTGLSSHEINQPGCYRDVKDTTVVAQFKVKAESNDKLRSLASGNTNENLHFIAWTTTPWTLPSNTALAVGPNIDYCIVNSFNQYTFKPITVVVAKALLGKHFSAKNAELSMADYNEGDKKIPFEVVGECKGSDLVGIKYEQLLPYALPYENPENAFQVIKGDFVTTEDGTGIVHIAPTFGADDNKVAQDAGVPPMLVLDPEGSPVPLVDLQGRFVPQMGEFAGMFVKNEYYKTDEAPDKSADVRIAIKLKEDNKAFKVEKYEHSYPHCWRTDKPVLYYPLDSWFVRATKAKKRMQELNETINWKPASTGSGRFGVWLENLNDWNLSRSRFWGIPIPIWRTEDGTEEICIGSAEELISEINKAVEAGLMDSNPFSAFTPGDMSEDNYDKIDLHKNYVDKVVLVSPSGKPMNREADLIDVWFDSGSMPYAQLHYPFENKELIDNNGYYPADFIAEGVDQTRGWFYTLHAIGAMVFDSVAYKNVISNGLVLDKNGKKMSKRLGNAVDPFETLKKHGPDATRWYMISNAQPWDNLKFDLDGITEVQRKFFGTLYNTYGFFALYANIDNFDYSAKDIPLENRPEIDRWVISKLNSLIKDVNEAFTDFEPTKATRLIQDFVTEHLSNWYVRLCRRRFWKGEMTNDKLAAYQTLYSCLSEVAKLSAPVAPFFTDQLYQDLNAVTGKETHESIHLSDYPVCNEAAIDSSLEERMEIAQKVTSMILGLRKKERLKVRQPLRRIMIPVLDANFKTQLEDVQSLILSEVNVKELEFLTETAGVLVKKIKPNFKVLGPKYGKIMKLIATQINQFEQDQISQIESEGQYSLNINNEIVSIDLNDVEITSEDIPGWLVATEGKYTVALDITLDDELKEEGIARELINRIQNLRKEKNFDVTDKISLRILGAADVTSAVNNNKNYICNETLTQELELMEEGNLEGMLVELEEDLTATISINKLN